MFIPEEPGMFIPVSPHRAIPSPGVTPRTDTLTRAPLPSLEMHQAVSNEATRFIQRRSPDLKR